MLQSPLVCNPRQPRKRLNAINLCISALRLAGDVKSSNRKRSEKSEDSENSENSDNTEKGNGGKHVPPAVIYRFASLIRRGN